MGASHKILLAAALLVMCHALQAQQQVRDLDIELDLTEKGSAIVHEAWNIHTGTGITEWYLVRNNLGDITIPSLYVSEGNRRFEDVGEWDVNKSLEEKAYKSGIVHKDNGVELCWGIGSYGDHIFHPVYGMTKAVKALNDYDMLHLQVVSPGLSSPPQHVRVTVKSDLFQMDTLNTRIWGFGFEGDAHVADGKAVFESSGPLLTEDSVIILLRFEKGLMQPGSIQERDFQEVLDQALAGSDYLMDDNEDGGSSGSGIAVFFTALVFFFIGRRFYKSMRYNGRKKFKGLTSKKIKNAPWYRDIPLHGSLEAADYMLTDLRVCPKKQNLALAMLLRLVHQGYLGVTREMEGPVKMPILSERFDQISSKTYSKLMYMAISAAGSNKILEEHEFSWWISDHASMAAGFVTEVGSEAVGFLKGNGYYNRSQGRYTEKGQEEAMKLLGLKKFLEDFTLSDQREAFEVQLWKEYLVYAALFGIADKVAKQLKDIDPKLFDDVFPYDLDSLGTICASMGDLSRSIDRVSSVYNNSESSGGSSYSRSTGGGGHTSRGGGSGYSGGGRGGGGR